MTGRGKHAERAARYRGDDDLAHAGPRRRLAAAIEVECRTPVPGWKVCFETAPVARRTGAAVQERDGLSFTGFGNVHEDAVDCRGKLSRLLIWPWSSRRKAARTPRLRRPCPGLREKCATEDVIRRARTSLGQVNVGGVIFLFAWDTNPK
jgi:hypothetical protein